MRWLTCKILLTTLTIMTPTELNQLPADQQQNALLALALGKQLHNLGYKDYWFDVNTALSKWQPQNDKALMWDLVCELSDCVYNGAWENLSDTKNYANSVIRAYISVDPKGLIATWRKENV